jgi:hypothetical protein
MAEPEQPQGDTTGEFGAHTPGYIKDMTPDVRVERMREVGAAGLAAQEIARVGASRASAEVEKEIAEKMAAIKVEKGVTELDDKVAWLSEAIRILQSYGQAVRVSNLDKVLVDLVETKAKVQLMLENQVTTDTIWAGVVEIVQATVTDEPTKQQLLTKIHEYLSTLIREALATKGTK